MSRPAFKLLLGFLLIGAVALAITACAQPDRHLFGGLGFDLAGAALQGLAGN